MKCCSAIFSALILSASICASAQAQVFGYGVNSDANTSADRLLLINLSNGQTQVLGQLGNANSEFEDVEALSFDKNGTLFGVDDALKTALTLNLNTGRGVALGGVPGNTRLAQGDNPQDPGLAFSCAGVMYLSAKNVRALYKVSPTTGATELIGTLGSLAANITDIAARGDELYGLGHDALYRIDVRNGSSQLVGNFGTDISFSEGGGLSTDPSGQLWAIAERRNDNGAMPSRIYRIDVATGSATFVANTAEGIESLAIGPTPCSISGAPVVTAIPTLSVAGISILFGLLLLAGLRFGHR